MKPPERLSAAARAVALRHWPASRLVRVGRAWAIVGRAAAVPISLDEPGGGTDTTDRRCICQFCQLPPGAFFGESGLPVGWYSVLVTGVDRADGPAEPRLWWTSGAFSLRRRKDAVAAAMA